jgi:hypothetical protein
MDEPVQKRTRVAREEWAKRVERWRDSGLTTAEFAAELGINPHSLTYWAWTLKREASGQKRIWTKKKVSVRSGRFGTKPLEGNRSAPRAGRRAGGAVVVA